MLEDSPQQSATEEASHVEIVLLWAVSDDAESWYGPHSSVESCVAEASDPNFHAHEEWYTPEYIFVAPGEEWWPPFPGWRLIEDALDDNECPVEEHPCTDDAKFATEFERRVDRAFKDACFACGIPKVYSVDPATAQKVALPTALGEKP